MNNIAGQLPCVLNGDVRITAVYGHAECACSIGNQNADGAETDNTELLALDFLTGELAFAFLNELRYVLIILDGLYEVNTAENVTACKKETESSESSHQTGESLRPV